MDEKRELQLIEDMAEMRTRIWHIDKRINGTMDVFQDHVKAGVGWRRTIILVVITVIVEVATFAFMFGCMTGRLEGLTKLVEAYHAGK